MSIDATHPAYDAAAPDWSKIEDITRRKNLSRHLIELNPQDKSEENRQRNKAYKERAIFFALSYQTVQGMIGTVYRRFPSLTAPTEMEYLKANADGAGVSIDQQSQAVTDDVIRKGRAGIAVSFPEVQGQVSRADITSGRVVATIHRFEPEQIINWRTERQGSLNKLSLVVVRQAQLAPKSDDQYEHEAHSIIREMFLDQPQDEDGNPVGEPVYRERQWTRARDGVWQPGEVMTPTDATGAPWTEIPFTFIGAENNDESVDHPPMLGIVDLNVGHWRNSADYEDSVWIAGQAQPWMSGVTDDHIEMMKEHGMYVGSRSLLPVPSGETFSYASAPPNPAVRQAMLDKVDMMVALGARIMQPGIQTKTATQAQGEREASTSVLGLVANNVSDAYTQALSWVAQYNGASDTDLVYEISQDFVEPEVSPQKLQQIMMGFLQGTMPLADYTRLMRRFGLFSDDTSDEDYAELLAPGGSGADTGGF